MSVPGAKSTQTGRGVNLLGGARSGAGAAGLAYACLSAWHRPYPRFSGNVMRGQVSVAGLSALGRELLRDGFFELLEFDRLGEVLGKTGRPCALDILLLAVTRERDCG